MIKLYLVCLAVLFASFIYGEGKIEIFHVNLFFYAKLSYSLQFSLIEN